MSTLTRDEMIANIATAYREGDLSRCIEAKQILRLPIPATDETPFVTVTEGLQERDSTELSTLHTLFVGKGWIKV